MKVAIISARYLDGFWNSIGRLTYSLAHGLVNQGHEVTVFGFNNSKSTRRYLDGRVQVVSIGGITNSPSKQTLMYEDIGAWNQAILHASAKKIDSILVLDWFGIEAALKLQVKHQAPVIGIPGLLANGRGNFAPFNDPGKVVEYRQRERDFLNVVDKVISFSPASTSEIQKFRLTDVHTLRLGIEEGITMARKTKSGKVVIMGRVCRERSVERVLRAIKDLVWVDLEIIGPGLETSYALYVKNIAKTLGIDDRIVWHGWVPDYDYAQHYVEAEMTICPSVYDPFSYSVLDPMSWKVPVIASYESYKGVADNLFQSVAELKDQMTMIHENRAHGQQSVAHEYAKVKELHTEAQMVEALSLLL